MKNFINGTGKSLSGDVEAPSATGNCQSYTRLQSSSSEVNSDIPPESLEGGGGAGNNDSVPVPYYK
jgi:hypothetical protein